MALFGYLDKKIVRGRGISMSGGVVFCLLVIGLCLALCYPPIFAIILFIAIPKIGIIPFILYLFFISWIYYKKKSVK